MRGGQEVARILAVLSALSAGLSACGGQNGTQSATGGESGTGTGGGSAGTSGSANLGGTGASAGAGHGGSGGGVAGSSNVAGAAGLGASGAAGTAGTTGTAGAFGMGGSAGAGGAGTVSAQFMPIVTSFCAAARTCCAKAGEDMMLDDCESAFFGRQVALASVDQGTVTVDSAALAKCQTAYQQAATACNENALLSACQGVFLGTKKVGEACTSNYECDRAQGAMSCLFPDNAQVGVCQKVPHGKSGEACLSTCRLGDDCSSDTFGATTSPTFCFESEGLYCGSVDASAAVCRPILATGEGCTSSDACGTLGVCYTTCQPAGVLHGPCGVGCRHDLTCVNDMCEDPSLAVGGTCLGYAPAP